MSGWMDACCCALLLCLLVVSSAMCQHEENQTHKLSTISSEANEFYIGFFENFVKPIDHWTIVLNDTTLHVISDGQVGVTLTSGTANATRLILVDEEHKIELPAGTRVTGPLDRHKGIHLKAAGNETIAVFGVNEEVHSVEGFTALPCSRLSHVNYYEYFAISVPRTATIASPTAHSVFLIVACEDNTNVTVTPTQSVLDPRDTSQQISPGESFTMVLHELETLYIESLDDLTGSRVISNVPISFFSGHECGNVPYNVTECDHLVEQIPPTSTWGTKFLTAPTPSRTAGDIFKIVAAEDDTTVNITCVYSDGVLAGRQSLFLANAGDSRNFTTHPINQYCGITSDQRILVTQFTPGQDADLSLYGDPFMVILPATSQYANSMMLRTADGGSLYFANFLNIFVSSPYFDASQIKVDNHVPNTLEWVAVYCEGMEVCGYTSQLRISVGVHHLSHDDPNSTIAAMVYGLAAYETYSYTAGLRLSVANDPMIVEPHQTSLFLFPGGSTCLRCDVSPGYLSPPFSWSFEGQPITPDGTHLQIKDDSSLCIKTAVREDTGNYSCHRGGDVLTYTLSVLSGIIVKTPTCRPQPTSINVVLLGVGLGSTTYAPLSVTTVDICCDVQGESPEVIWLQNNIPLPAQQQGYEVEDGYLHLTGPFTAGCRVYTCQAIISSAIHEESAEICFGNDAPPTTVIITGKINVVEGESTALVCSPNGFPAPVTIWTTASETKELPSNVENFGNGTLVVRGVAEGAETRYCCVAVNDHGNATNCTTIIILVPPEIQQPTFPNSSVTPVPFGVTLPLAFNIIEQADIGQTIFIVKTYHLRINCEIARGNPSPTITWLHNGSQVPSSYQVLSNGSLLIEGVSPERDNGIITCLADTPGVGKNNRTSTIVVIEPPAIKQPSGTLHSAGNCKDITDKIITSEQVGVDLCVRGGLGAKLYLHCASAMVVPAPTVLWFKDGIEINESLEYFYVFDNGTLLVEHVLLPVDAHLNNLTDITGMYTCVVTNIAGIANASSFIVPFGDISEDSVKSHYVQIHSELYHQIQSELEEKTELLRKGEQVLVLLTAGKVLKYNDYFPGHSYDGGEYSVLPQTMENMFDLVNVIPDAERLVTRCDDSEPLSEVYEQLLHQMRVAPRTDIADETRTFLQERVSDIGDESADPLPRLSIYLKYKSKYYAKKLSVDDEIDRQRKHLGFLGKDFNQWYSSHGHYLESEVNAAMLNWTLFGNKTLIEEKLTELNLEDFSAKLDEARAVLIATHVRSRYRDDKRYYPVQYIPDIWFELLESRVDHSIEQMQFHLAQLQTQKQVLEITRTFLEEEYHRNFYHPYLDTPQSVYNQLEAAWNLLEIIVVQSEEQRYECLVTRRPLDCQLYSLEAEAVISLVDVFSELYWQAEFVRAATNHRDFSIPAITSTINSLAKDIEKMEFAIHVAIVDSASRAPEDEEKDRYSVDPLTKFTFSSMPSSGNRQTDFQFSLSESIQKRLLWYMDPASTRLTGAETTRMYNATLNHFNTLETNVTATFIRVRIRRRWLKPDVFESTHLSLKDPQILVSPGKIKPVKDFRDILENGTFRLPLYPTSLVLATDIKLTIEVPFPFHSLPPLLRLASDPYISGGFGPFVFGPLFKGSTSNIKFRVDIQDNHITISLPSTQLIGYICDFVPKHPSAYNSQTSSSSETSHEKRDRRSASLSDMWEQYVEEFHSQQKGTDANQRNLQPHSGYPRPQRVYTLQQTPSLSPLQSDAEDYQVYANVSVSGDVNDNHIN